MLKQLITVFAVSAVLMTTGVAAEADPVSLVSDERGVKITVIANNLSEEAAAWDFEVTLETHTQPLNEDLALSSVLIANGKQYAPLGWAGAPPGGHHRKGLLRFQAITPRPRSVELQIRLTGDTAPRSFKWLLK
jgi:hypothetical protein